MSAYTSGTALALGFASFFSPCTLVLLPAYQSFLAGALPSQLRASPRLFRRKLFRRTVFFCIGFATAFILLGLAASGIADLLPPLPLLRPVAGGVLVLLGLHVGGLSLLPRAWRGRVFNLFSNLGGYRPGQGAGALGSAAAGAAFALGWTPCTGPLIAAVSVMATEGDAFYGAWLLGLYALGLSIPFILSALFQLPFQGLLRSPRTSQAAGVLLVLTGLSMIPQVRVWFDVFLKAIGF